MYINKENFVITIWKYFHFFIFFIKSKGFVRIGYSKDIHLKKQLWLLFHFAFKKENLKTAWKIEYSKVFKKMASDTARTSVHVAAFIRTVRKHTLVSNKTMYTIQLFNFRFLLIFVKGEEISFVLLIPFSF